MALRGDFVFGLRMLRKNPLLLVVASLSLGLGIGLNTTVFSLVSAALLRGPDVERADDLVNLYSSKAGVSDLNPNSYADFLDMRERLTSFDALVAYSFAMVSYDRSGLPSAKVGAIVTGDYFDLLEAVPRLGRLFLGADFDADAAVVVVSHRFWQRELGGEPSAIGRAVRLGNRFFEVVGVLPEDFTGFSRGLIPEVFVPITQAAGVQPIGEIAADGPPSGETFLDWRGYRFLTVTGRLAPGVTAAQAQGQANALASALAEQFPASNLGRSAVLLPTLGVRVDPDVDGILIPAAILLTALFAVVLVVACANVANLLLAKAQSRGTEMALRTALGAGRWRIARQWLVEGLLYGLVCGAVGLLGAALAIRLIGLVKLELPIEPQLALRLDAPVLLFTLAVSLAASLIFGLISARHAGRLAVMPLLRSSGTTGASGRWFDPANLIVIAQVAVSLVLVFTAGLMLRSLEAARDVDVGFEVDRLGNVSIDLRSADLAQDNLALAWRRIESRVEALPGMETVALASRLPLGTSINTNDFFIPGHRDTEADPPIHLDTTTVDEDYFAALGLSLVSGRLLDERDVPSTARVAVVTEAMVERFWPSESALGKRFRVGSSDSPEFEIVGVVGDYKVRTPGERPRPMVHFAWQQRPPAFGALTYRSAGPPERMLEQVVAAARAELPSLLLVQSTTTARMRDLLLLPLSAGSIAAAALGALALFLAVVGLSGLIIYWVSRRTREIGLRMALGAGRSSVVRLVAGRAFALIGLGLALGAVGSVVLGRLLEPVLYVPAFDPVSLSIGVAVLLSAGVLASVVPVRRAASIDPMTAWRSQ